MRKVFVLDTNVILSDAESIFKFQEHTVVIPMPVIEEIDRFKKEKNELGRNARAFGRYMDDLRKKGSLFWEEEMATVLGGPVIVNNDGGIIKVVLYHDHFGSCLCGADMDKPDNQIIACAMSINNTDNSITILVSRDINMRIRGDLYGVYTQDYENGKVETDDLYTGCSHLYVPGSLIDLMYKQGKLDLGSLKDAIGDIELLNPNAGIIIHSEIDEKHSALCYYDAMMRELVRLPDDQTLLGITPRNAEQRFALNLLTDPNIELVTMTGKAGSGKTLMAMVGGLYGVLEQKLYDKIVLLKPIVAMDNSHELGFLPGTMDEKLAPWMASYSDNLSVIMNNLSKDDLLIKKKKSGKKLTKAEQQALDDLEEKSAGRVGAMEELKAFGLVECGSLEHMRGRSLPKQFIVIDEAQNVTPHALKTVISRAGEGTKIIVMGDLGQIDNPYLDSCSNGLAYVIEKMKEFSITGHIHFRKSERSKLAELASDVL